MTTDEKLKKLEDEMVELQKKLKELESRQIFIVPYPYPYYPVSPSYPTYPIVTVSNGTTC